MAKPEIIFACQSCGQESPRWYGQCPTCGEWNTLVEEKGEVKTDFPGRPKAQGSVTPLPITDVKYLAEERKLTGIKELDRVLGGGVVGGSVVLIAGEPGIGKSTMMLQAAEALSRKCQVLYVSGEESPRQIRLRGERLGALSKNLLVLPETNLFAIEKTIEEIKPQFVIIDSIQTIYREDFSSTPGSVAQVRECAAYLVNIAKLTGIPIFIVGHVTKEGAVAVPRVLEHVVDTVLYFEGDQHRQYRLLRATKNRFGSTKEVGIFEMSEQGLGEVTNPSELFLSERPEGVAGSVVVAAMEGSRPLLVEIQALVAVTRMAYPVRKVTGVDYNRTLMIIAIIEKQLGLKLAQSDIYINAVGGVRITEPAIDLPIALAIISCYKNKIIQPKTVALGELGLTGEVRSVSHLEERIKEAEKLGFTSVIVPAAGAKKIKKTGVKIEAVTSIKEAAAASLQ